MIDPNPNVIEDETEDPYFPDDVDIYEGEESTDRPEGGIVPDLPPDEHLSHDERWQMGGES